jgi:DNA polymerase III delta prime subunit
MEKAPATNDNNTNDNNSSIIAAPTEIHRQHQQEDQKDKEPESSIATTHTRVMALGLRPRLLQDLVGQSDLTHTIKSQFTTGRIPHFFIIHGPVGAGKTTLARILSLRLQLSLHEAIEEKHWTRYRDYDIQEINAANRNGIDDIRSVVEAMKYQPMHPSRAKVVIMDEAHQLTIPAQNALATEVEDVPESVFYIFCTSAIEKIIPALRRRAYTLSPKPLSPEDCLLLLQRAAAAVGFDGALDPLHEALMMNSVASPGLILQATEKFFSGIPALDSVFDCDSNSKLDTNAVCKALAKGSWKEVASELRNITKSEVGMMRNCMLGYMKSILLSSLTPGARALAVARAMATISSSATLDAATSHSSSSDVPLFLASVCIACDSLAPPPPPPAEAIYKRNT